jgi:hypothetical protein
LGMIARRRVFSTRALRPCSAAESDPDDPTQVNPRSVGSGVQHVQMPVAWRTAGSGRSVMVRSVGTAGWLHPTGRVHRNV